MNCKSILFGILAVMLIFTSCNKSDDLTNVIPSDAVYIISVDNAALIKKSEYDIFKNQTIERGINMAKAFVKDQEQVKLIDAFLKDANSLGLNLKNDVYMYTTYKVYGVVMGVNDASKFKNTLLVSTAIKEDQLTEEGGIYVVSPEKNVCLVWDDSKLLLLANIATAFGSDEEIDIVAVAKKQLKQTAENSINTDKSFVAFSKKKTEISAFYRSAGLEEFMELATSKNNQLAGFDFKKYIQEFKGVSAGLYGSFDKGAIVFDSEYYYDTDADKARFEKLVSQYVGVLNDDQLKYFAAEPLFLATANVKGESACQNLKDFGVFDLYSEMMDSTTVSTVENVLSKVNGDVTFAITGLNSDASKNIDQDQKAASELIPQMVFFADVTDSEYIVNLIKDNFGENAPVKTITPSVFSFAYDSANTVYFGVVNNLFFMTNIESMYNNLSTEGLKSPFQANVKGKSMYVFGDLEILKASLEKNELGVSDKNIVILTGLIAPFSKYEMSVSDNMASSGRLELVNKDQNSLKTICGEIDRLINESASSFM